MINQTNLDYTILQATALIDGPATGNIAINEASESQNTIGNVAMVLAAIINHESTSKKVIRMSDGGTSIDAALSSL